MIAEACANPRCGRSRTHGSFLCSRCWRMVPAAIRVDLEVCIRRGWAFSPLSPLWRTSSAAALAALELTAIPRSDTGRTAHAHRRRSRAA